MPTTAFSCLSYYWGLPRPALICATLMFCVAAGVAPAYAEAPSTFMQRVANQLVAASRAGSPTAFASVLRSHGDLPSIGLYALGDYQRRLPQTDRPAYYAGMVNWISNYVAKEGQNYPVAKAVVLGQTEETAKGAYVDSRVTMRDGTTYDVRWWLVRRGQTFKVGDAQVLSFWGRDSLRSLFEKFISENGGDPRKLVAALNQ